MGVKNEPYKTILEHLAELEGMLGQELGLSPWTTITQEQITTFAKITGDEQWIHIDVERSKKESPYGTTIAHGFMILSLASKFAYETMHISDVGMGLNYGLDKVRFMNATPSGAKVRGRISLMEYEAIDHGAKYKVKIIFELQGQEKPACVAEFLAHAYTSKK
ncbi:MAG: MaoC family dehydratase [Cytophagales bacterium]|nr:MaoC family dehydratase [Cytophagales bacterium]